MRIGAIFVACVVGSVMSTGGSHLLAAVQQPQQQPPQQQQQRAPRGWNLPADAEEKKNPHAVDDTLLATGKAVYKDKCDRCHGPGGLGDGPDSDPDAREDMNLTDPKRIEANPDGIVFYKVWNGRRSPKMPAFKEELTEDQVWAVVAYVQSLRKK